MPGDGTSGSLRTDGRAPPRAEPRAPPVPFVAPWATGARVRYRGRRVRLVVERGDPSVRFQGRLVVRLPEPSPDAVRDAVDAWMRGRALDAAATLAGEYAARLGVPCPEVRLTDSARCWGECDRSGVVRVHAELIRAPFPLFSYVVAHEVAHLRVRSHSPAFWAALTGLLPEARALDAELRRWGAGAREL